MDGYDRFFIHERSDYPQGKGAQFIVVATSSEHSSGETSRVAGNSLSEAMAEVRIKAEARLARARAEVAGWEQQLAELDQHYATIATPGEILDAHATEFVAAAQRYQRTGTFAGAMLGYLKVAFGYGETPGLMVFSLPEYNAINCRFLENDVETLKALLVQAGFKDTRNSWNGAGFQTLSIRVPAVELEALEPQAA